MAVLGAQPNSGIDVVLDLINFHESLLGARLVITGEGRLDEQTLHGKAPAESQPRRCRPAYPVVAGPEARPGRCAPARRRVSPRPMR